MSEKPLDLAAIRARCEDVNWLAKLHVGTGSAQAGALVRASALVADIDALLSALDAAMRALLKVEWNRRTRSVDQFCPVCAGYALVVGDRPRHNAGCALDAALTATGLDTPEKRDAARAKMGEAP